jgi:hypothetical protein
MNKNANEVDPDTEAPESNFRREVRDILGLSPFDRATAIYAELRRLVHNDKALMDHLEKGGEDRVREANIIMKTVKINHEKFLKAIR